MDKAVNLLLVQHEYPLVYNSDTDKVHNTDSDRCSQFDYEHTAAAYKRHDAGRIEQFSHRRPEEIMAFLIDILKADKKVEWTGFRISGSVNVSNGYPIYHFALFSKGQDSTTQVYSGHSADNIAWTAEQARTIEYKLRDALDGIQGDTDVRETVKAVLQGVKTGKRPPNRYQFCQYDD